MINQIIVQYLVNGKRLVVPGFGAFIHKEADNAVVFVPFLKKDDGVLSGILTAEYGVDTQDAQGIISEYIKQIGDSIESKGLFTIEGLGHLKVDANGIFYLDYQPEGENTAASGISAPTGPTAVPVDQFTPSEKEPLSDNDLRSVVGRPIQSAQARNQQAGQRVPNPQTPGTARTLYDKLAAQANGAEQLSSKTMGPEKTLGLTEVDLPAGTDTAAYSNVTSSGTDRLQQPSRPAVEPMGAVRTTRIPSAAAPTTTSKAHQTVKDTAKNIQSTPPVQAGTRPDQIQSIDGNPSGQPSRPVRQPVQKAAPVNQGRSGQPVHPVQSVQPEREQAASGNLGSSHPGQPDAVRSGHTTGQSIGQPAGPRRPIPRSRPGQRPGQHPSQPRPAGKTAKADKFMIIAILAALIALAAIVYGVVWADKGPAFHPIEIPEPTAPPVTDSIPAVEDAQP